MAGIASLKRQAKKVQRKGRGYDSVLVHMDPRELKGLQALAMQHGGSLTRNPKTGLYEAGFLSSILPMIAGGIGASFGMPWLGVAAGAGVGALTNRQNPLMGGIMGGLGGWGGSSMFDKLMAAGLPPVDAGTLTNTFGSPATTGSVMFENPDMLGFARNTISESIAANPSNIFSPDQIDFARSAIPSTEKFISPAFGAEEASKEILKESMSGYIPNTFADAYPDISRNRVTPTVNFDSPLDQLWSGVKNVGANLTKEPKKTLREYGLPAAAALSPLLMAGEGKSKYGIPTGSSLMPPYSRKDYAYTPSRSIYPGIYSNPYYTLRAAEGGLMGLAKGGASQSPRMIRGPGTGLSDSVPAQIEGGRPAALADGEFVVSSDVVSALGGGSTDAGARRLYAMMDRVRRKAHGTKKQVRKVPNNTLPA
jgi:hypothetical protein